MANDVSPPRSIWLEILFGFTTFGAYYCFWHYKMAKELNFLAKEERFTPWLWALVPLFWLAQVFAYPRLFRCIRETVDVEHNQPLFFKRLAKLWIALIILTTFIAGLSFSLKFPLMVDICVLVSTVTLYSLFQFSWNRIKSDSMGLVRKNKLKIWEWVVLFTVSPVMLFGMYVIVNEEISIVSRAGNGDIVSSDQYGYRFAIFGDRWRQLELGTISDGSAVLEYADHDSERRIFIFDQSDASNISSIFNFRYDELELTSDILPECEENRKLDESGKNVIASLRCEVETVLGKEITLSTVIWGDATKLEMYATYFPTFGAKRSYKMELLNIVASFRSYVKE